MIFTRDKIRITGKIKTFGFNSVFINISQIRKFLNICLLNPMKLTFFRRPYCLNIINQGNQDFYNYLKKYCTSPENVFLSF